MPIRYEVPELLKPHDMFVWWAHNKMRNKRHLKLKYLNSNSKPTELISNNKDELEWIKSHINIMKQQIEDMEEIDSAKSYFTSTTKMIYNLKQELYEYKERIKILENSDLKKETIIMDSRTFRKILLNFNKNARRKIIYEGGILALGNNLGYIYPAVIDRFAKVGSKSAKMPDWNKSIKYRDELIEQGVVVKSKDNPNGKPWIIYHSDDYYLRIAWAKNFGASHVKRIKYYRFEPSNGDVGFKKEFVRANKSNPLLKRKYFIPKVKNAYYSKKANKGSHEHIEVHVGKGSNR